MNTYITRVWRNNSNHFVISESKEIHDLELADLKDLGGRVFESEVFTGELGDVAISRENEPVPTDEKLGTQIVELLFLSEVMSAINVVAHRLVNDECVSRKEAALDLVQISDMLYRDMNGIFEFYREKVSLDDLTDNKKSPSLSDQER